MGRKPTEQSRWQTLLFTTWSPAKTTDLKDHAVRVGKNMAVFTQDAHPFLITGHQSMTLTTVQNPMALIRLLGVIKLRNHALTLICFTEETGLGGR